MTLSVASIYMYVITCSRGIKAIIHNVSMRIINLHGHVCLIATIAAHSYSIQPPSVYGSFTFSNSFLFHS